MILVWDLMDLHGVSILQVGWPAVVTKSAKLRKFSKHDSYVNVYVQVMVTQWLTHLLKPMMGILCTSPGPLAPPCLAESLRY
jgi:hypothetical protein